MRFSVAILLGASTFALACLYTGISVPSPSLAGITERIDSYQRAAETELLRIQNLLESLRLRKLSAGRATKVEKKQAANSEAGTGAAVASAADESDTWVHDIELSGWAEFPAIRGASFVSHPGTDGRLIQLDLDKIAGSQESQCPAHLADELLFLSVLAETLKWELACRRQDEAHGVYLFGNSIEREAFLAEQAKQGWFQRFQMVNCSGSTLAVLDGDVLPRIQVFQRIAARIGKIRGQLLALGIQPILHLPSPP